jgi:hypothetical protein
MAIMAAFAVGKLQHVEIVAQTLDLFGVVGFALPAPRLSKCRGKTLPAGRAEGGFQVMARFTEDRPGHAHHCFAVESVHNQFPLVAFH